MDSKPIIKYEYSDFFPRLRDVLIDIDMGWAVRGTEHVILEHTGMMYLPDRPMGMFFEIHNINKHRVFTLRHGVTGTIVEH